MRVRGSGCAPTFRAYRDIGIRATVALTYEDRVNTDRLPIHATRLPPEVQARRGAMVKPAP